MDLTHVYVHVNDADVEAFIEASRENARRSVQEPGNVAFDILQQADDRTRFVLIEGYESADAAAAHKETAHYQTWRDTVAPMMAEPRTHDKFNLVHI